MTSGKQIGTWVSAMALALSFLLLVLAGLYTFRQQNHVNERLCNANVENRAALRRTWQAAERLIVTREMTPEQMERFHAIFAGVLDTIPPLECVNSQPKRMES